MRGVWGILPVSCIAGPQTNVEQRPRKHLYMLCRGLSLTNEVAPLRRFNGKVPINIVVWLARGMMRGVVMRSAVRILSEAEMDVRDSHLPKVQ